jgi:hypothetical protein
MRGKQFDSGIVRKEWSSAGDSASFSGPSLSVCFSYIATCAREQKERERTGVANLMSRIL